MFTNDFVIYEIVEIPRNPVLVSGLNEFEQTPEVSAAETFRGQDDNAILLEKGQAVLYIGQHLKRAPGKTTLAAIEEEYEIAKNRSYTRIICHPFVAVCRQSHPFRYSLCPGGVDQRVEEGPGLGLDLG
jgi:hypothetical protein